MALIANNSIMEVQDKTGDFTKHFPITTAKNVLGITERIQWDTKDMTDVEVALYKALRLLSTNAYVVDDDDNTKLYKIGVKSGSPYVVEVESEEGPDAIISEIMLTLKAMKETRDGLTGHITLQGHDDSVPES